MTHLRRLHLRVPHSGNVGVRDMDSRSMTLVPALSGLKKNYVSSSNKATKQRNIVEEHTEVTGRSMYYLVTTWDGLLLGGWKGAGPQLVLQRKKKKRHTTTRSDGRQEKQGNMDAATKVIPRSTPISRSRQTDNVCVTSHDGEFHFTSKRLSVTTGAKILMSKCSLQCLASCLFIPLYDTTPLRLPP